VCVGQKIFRNASSRVASAFKDVILNENQPTESHWNVSYPTQDKAILIAVISATSY